MAHIETYVQPRRLYRYRSLANLQREMDAIQKSYLFCSTYRKLNDPMEGLFTSSRLFRKSEKYRTVRNAIRDNKAHIGVCSFSEVYDHELMWAHYANQFTGICISYSFSRLLRNLADEITFVRMYYNETVPTVHRTSKDTDELARMVLSYKNYRWLYEREWRMFADQGKVHYKDVECVTRVYLGSRISDVDKTQVTKALNRLRIPTSEMTIDKYFLNFEERDSD
ncbi:MAG TPA: DUF2971 domain-containing protein [Candidatus Angelobacter sp.]|nr:DUF2971 domain-containing protein [Candidatus Angelobacter sp.]